LGEQHVREYPFGATGDLIVEDCVGGEYRAGWRGNEVRGWINLALRKRALRPPNFWFLILWDYARRIWPDLQEKQKKRNWRVLGKNGGEMKHGR